MQRFFFRLIGVALVIAACGCGRSVPGVPIDPVPGKVPEPYRVIYRELESELSQLNPILAAPWGRKSRPHGLRGRAARCQPQPGRGPVE